MNTTTGDKIRELRFNLMNRAADLSVLELTILLDCDIALGLHPAFIMAAEADAAWERCKKIVNAPSKVTAETLTVSQVNKLARSEPIGSSVSEACRFILIGTAPQTEASTIDDAIDTIVAHINAQETK